MSTKKKVGILFTGGTISMTIDKEIGANVPTLSGEQIMSMATNVKDVAEFEIKDFDEIPGPHMTPEKLLHLKDNVLELLNREDICGVVITHGTDSLEESAYFLDLVINHEKPVVVTGAMRSSSELGVLVVLNNEVLLASEATKTDTMALNTFQSPAKGSLGIVDNNELLLYKNVAHRTFIDTDKVENKVALFKSGIGMDDTFINHAVDMGYKGIVIEAMGRGNIPPQMYEGVKYARENGVVVVITSRCSTGRVHDSYGYLGSGRDLKNIGCIFAGDLNGHKCRIKLMLALGKTNNLDEIKDFFEKGIYY